MAEPEEGEDLDLTARPSTLLRRDADLLGRNGSACRKFLAKKIDAIVRGFEEQASRSDNLDKWWRIFNCELDANQFYNGNAQVYVPIIRDAINARATRFANQLFPQSGRFVDVTATDGSTPYEIIAILNHYIGDAKLKTEIVRPLLRTGDIEGQMNLYVDWRTVTRHVVSRETRAPIDPLTNMELPGEEVVDIVEEEIREGRPGFEVLHDSDVVVLPATAESVDDALAKGGTVTIVRRWSRSQYDAMIDDGEIKSTGAEDEDGRLVDATMTGLSDLKKALAKAVGIRASGPHFIGFETWLMVPMDAKGFAEKKGADRLCRLWWGLDKEPLGLKRNPFWNDRCPLLSAAVEKIPGVFKGKSQIEALAPLQYEANDAANERADVDHYGAMPIIRRTPGEGNSPLVLNLAAIWDAPDKGVEFLVFPDLSQRANARIMAATQVIFQSLGINPAMLPQQSGRPGAKRNQAEVAMEQAVDLLTVAEAVEVPDQQILTPLVGWMVDLDHQYRDSEMTVRAYGELGIMAQMIDVGPIENRRKYRFVWAGAQQAKQNAAMMQQGTALLNVAQGAAQQLQSEGYQLRLGPSFERAFGNVFGPETARLTLVDIRRQLSIDAESEIEMMLDGFQTWPQPMDNDQEKIQLFRQAMMQLGDPHGTIRMRLQLQLKAMQMKTAAAAMKKFAEQMQAGGQPPGGGAPGPRGPQPGAVPAGPRLIKGPPGTISQDQLPRAGAVVPPRRA